MKKLFLDTSAYSAFKRGNPDVLEWVRHADTVFLNAIVLGELFSGFEGGRFRQPNRKELREFLDSTSVSIHPMTQETAERYAVIHFFLKKEGTPIPTNDLWIAASVMETGCTLVTFDRHFAKIPQIHSIIFPPA